MTVGFYIATIIVMLVMAIIIAVGFRFLPEKLSQAILCSMVLVLSALLLTASLVTVIYKDTEVNLLVFACILASTAAIVVALAFYLTYRVADKGKRERVFFYTVLSIAVVACVCYLVDVIVGAKAGYATLLPADICPQIGYALPLVYFMKEKVRRWLLPSVCLLCISLGAGAVCAPVWVGATNPVWEVIQALFVHYLMIWVPVAILVMRQVAYRYIDIAVLAGFTAVLYGFAFLGNRVNFWQEGEPGNYAFLDHGSELVPWISAWVVGVWTFVGNAAAIALIKVIKPRL